MKSTSKKLHWADPLLVILMLINLLSISFTAFVAWGLTWPTVMAKVVSANVQEILPTHRSGQSRYLLILTYSYPNGATLQTNQEIVDQTSPKEDLNAAAARYKDKTVKAYVNPLNPGMATINPGQNFANGLIPTILLLMLTGFIFFVKADTDKKDNLSENNSTPAS